MARPPKYANPHTAAIGYVMGRLNIRTHEEYKLTQQPCYICSVKPMELEHVKRRDGEYKLYYNRLTTNRDKPICKMCQAMIKIATVGEVISYSARVMAKRKHELDTKWVSESQEKPTGRT